MFKNYDEVKKEIKVQLSNVDTFQLKFLSPTQLSTLRHVRPGSVRKCIRVPGSSHFIMANSKIVISFSSVAHLISLNEAELILPEAKGK